MVFAWEQPRYAWNSLHRNLKRGLWIVALVVAPIAFYALSHFLYDKLDAGHYEWFFFAVALGIGAGFAIDIFNDRYGS